MNKAQHTTNGIKHWGVKWLCKRHLSHQSLLYLDSEVSPYSPTISYRHPLGATGRERGGQ
jgi:hypothetical protein